MGQAGQNPYLPHILIDFSHIYTSVLVKSCSNHIPLIIRPKEIAPRYGAHVFKFMRMWCNHMMFGQLIHDNWNQPIDGGGLMKFTAKVKRLKPILKIWNKEIFGRVENHVQNTKDDIMNIEAQMMLTTVMTLRCNLSLNKRISNSFCFKKKFSLNRNLV